MPRTPDRFPGVREDEGIILSDESTQPSQVGELRNDGGDFYAQDNLGVFNLRQDGVIVRLISADLTIVAGTTRLHRETVIANGVEVTIEDTGELLVL